MVDAMVAAKVSTDAPVSTPSRSAVSIRCDVADSGANYQSLAQRGLYAPPQSPAWIEAWVNATSPDVLSAVIIEAERPVFVLALEVVRRHGYRVARFMGGTHANGNFALADPDWLARAEAPVFNELVAAISHARPDVDVIALQRLLPRHGRFRNPLLSLPQVKSPNVSLAVNLDGGFDNVVSGPSGKRKRKKHRTQARKYEAVGSFQRIEADTPEEVNRLLVAFFEMKLARFRKAGIANVFAEREVQDFFRALFIGALGKSPKPFVLHGLDVAGKLRAVTGSSLAGDRLVCEFGSIAEDELWNASPGEYLFFENIKGACEQGLAIYDFSVGDEAYKRVWCDIEVQLADVVVPLTLKGRLVAGGMRLITDVKGRIKSSPAVWRLAKTLRQRASGQKPAEQAREED